MQDPLSNIARLRGTLDSHHPAMAMASHNPMSAKLDAEGVLTRSGEAASSCLRPPDASILSADTHLELMRAIGEVQDAPVIADLDTGYGNVVNVAYLVPRYAAAGFAAVTIEDKTFPKDSSLRLGGRQVLVPIEEFQGKIETARLPDGPLVVAATEALIAGLGQAEALWRGLPGGGRGCRADPIVLPSAGFPALPGRHTATAYRAIALPAGYRYACRVKQSGGCGVAIKIASEAHDGPGRSLVRHPWR